MLKNNLKIANVIIEAIISEASGDHAYKMYKKALALFEERSDAADAMPVFILAGVTCAVTALKTRKTILTGDDGNSAGRLVMRTAHFDAFDAVLQVAMMNVASQIETDQLDYLKSTLSYLEYLGSKIPAEMSESFT